MSIVDERMAEWKALGRKIIVANRRRYEPGAIFYFDDMNGHRGEIPLRVVRISTFEEFVREAPSPEVAIRCKSINYYEVEAAD